jgi:hypothetical protein
MLRLADL